MQNPYLKCFLNNCKKNNRGFSLIELMVVLVIVGILATGVVFMFANPNAKVKAEGFQMLGNFNLARAEAVRRNQNILVQFYDTAQETCGKKDWDSFQDCFTGGNYHGYAICFDEDGDNDCETEVQSTAPATPAEEAEVAEDLEEKIIKTIIFKEFVKYYDIGPTAPTDGPASAPNGDALTSTNGVTFDPVPGFPNIDYFSMAANGTSTNTGAVVIYYPEGTGTAIRGSPYALVVNNVGNISFTRWNKKDSNWQTK